MSVSTTKPSTRPTTAEEILALPEDGIHRELIRGELRERPMTARNKRHSRIEAELAKLLGNWLDNQSQARGAVVSGEAGFRLTRAPDTVVAVDVALIGPELAAQTGPGFFEGAPILAVEILSPSDTQGEVAKKVALYLEFGSVVWVVDPDFQTVAIHRPGSPSVTLNNQKEISGEPYLPNFHAAVASIFRI